VEDILEERFIHLVFFVIRVVDVYQVDLVASHYLVELFEPSIASGIRALNNSFFTSRLPLEVLGDRGKELEVFQIYALVVVNALVNDVAEVDRLRGRWLVKTKIVETVDLNLLLVSS